MKFLGILRASGLFIFLSAFHGPRGVFCSNLEIDLSNESFTVEVSENLEDSTVESSSQESIPAAKSGLVFQSSEWNDSHLASSVLFLEEFCKDVISKKFNEKLSEAEYDDVSRVCVYLSFKLESVTNHFAPAYGPGTVTERKDIPKNFYKDVLKPEKFDVYAIWLEKNIQNITESYKKMLEESVKLTATELKNSDSVGPPKYGFVYNGYWWGEIVYWLPPEVYADTGFLEALNELKTSLDKIPKSPVETSTVEPQVAEDALEESSKVHESDIAEKSKDSTVESPLVENPSQEPSTLNLSDGSKSLDEVLKELKEKRKAEHEELLKRISEQRKELVERLSKSDAPFSLEDMTLFLGILRDEPDVNPEAVQKVGEEIHAYLGSLGIHGEDAKGSLEKLMKKIQEYVLNSSSSSSEPSPDDASTQEIKAILEQLPDSNVNSLSGDFYAPKKPFNVEVPDIYEDPEMLSMECRISDPDGACVYVPSNLSYLPEYQKKAETKDDESKSKDRRKGFFGKLFGWLY